MTVYACARRVLVLAVVGLCLCLTFVFASGSGEAQGLRTVEDPGLEKVVSVSCDIDSCIYDFTQKDINAILATSGSGASGYVGYLVKGPWGAAVTAAVGAFASSYAQNNLGPGCVLRFRVQSVGGLTLTTYRYSWFVVCPPQGNR